MLTDPLAPYQHKAPFFNFGGKRFTAAEVWRRFGSVQNYVEPFCGSAAVLLARPDPPGYECVNDINCFISNFYRAIAADPDAVAEHADHPVNEADLHARHRRLMLSDSAEAWRERMKTDPDYFDAKIAGWWVWGAGCWLGSGWCDGGRLFGRDGGNSNNYNTGLSRQLPIISSRNTIEAKYVAGDIHAYFRALSTRLRRVRVACGDWRRVLSYSATTGLGVTGVFLDPPYAIRAMSGDIYANDSRDISADVRAWALELPQG